MKRLLNFSLTVNLILLIVIAIAIINRGGVSYIIQKIKTKRLDFPQSYFWRVEIFKKMNAPDSAVYLFGDSFIENFEWSEFNNNEKVVNRGINHDTIKGLIKRLQECPIEKSEKIFILIGINDLRKGIIPDKFEKDYLDLFLMLTEKKTDAQIFFISLLPTDNITRSNNDIIVANQIIKKLCIMQNCYYIDLYNFFLNENGNLIEIYSYDGLHLNGEGYLFFANKLKSYIN